jgi:MazG family protein
MELDRLSKAFHALVKLVAELRGPGGCPWDAKQTYSTIKTYLLEEVYEALEAIERSSAKDICAELGDLLFQIIFIATIAEERNDFDLLDVLENISKKMIRRHPHVFGEANVESSKEVATNWALIKKAEKGPSATTTSFLKDVPKNLPALLRAHRINERASKTGFAAFNQKEIEEIVGKDFNALQEAASKGNAEGVGEAMGAMLFSLATMARLWGHNAEDLLRLSVQQFVASFEKAELALNSKGIDIEKATLEQVNNILKKDD